MYEELFDCEKQHEMRNFFLNDFSNYGEKRSFRKNEQIIIREKRFIAVVTNGSVKRSFYNSNGDEKYLYYLKPGEIFGEEEYFEGVADCFINTAIQNTDISIIHSREVEKLLDFNADIYRFIIHSLVRKYRISITQMVNICFNDSTQKVADTLIRLWTQSKEIGTNNEKIVINLTHQDIADIIGCSRITVTRTLKKFKQENIITSENRSIVIKDINRLKRYLTNNCNK